MHRNREHNGHSDYFSLVAGNWTRFITTDMVYARVYVCVYVRNVRRELPTGGPGQINILCLYLWIREWPECSSQHAVPKSTHDHDIARSKHYHMPRPKQGCVFATRYILCVSCNYKISTHSIRACWLWALWGDVNWFMGFFRVVVFGGWSVNLSFLIIIFL